jgi:acetyl-CoA carboxylase biotin carboxyl carrier protein
MNMKEIKELLDLVVDKGFTEFELERSGLRLRLKRDLGRPGDPSGLSAGPVISYAPIQAAIPAAAPPQAALEARTTPPAAPAVLDHVVKSPIVGTFYESPAPGTPAFVSVGSRVTKGQVLCIIEAMKLMNEIESDANGTISQRLVQNGQPVEYGQPLFAVQAD